MHQTGILDTTHDALVVRREQVDGPSLLQAVLDHPECQRLIPPFAESSKAFLRLPDRNRRNPRFLSFVAQKDPVFLARLLCMTTQPEFANAGCCASNAEQAIAILGIATSISVMQEAANIKLPSFAEMDVGSRFWSAQQMIQSRCVTHAMTAQRLAVYLELDEVQSSRLQICCLLDNLGFFVGLYGNEELSSRLQDELFNMAATGTCTQPLAQSEILHDHWMLSHYLARQWNVEWAAEEFRFAEKSTLMTLVLTVEKLIAAKSKKESQMDVLRSTLKRHAGLTSRVGVEVVDLAILPW